MSDLKRYHATKTVYQAACDRISESFDLFERLYVSFSAGKDSTVMLHMVMAEAIKRKRKIGVLIIDLEAQYEKTIDHMQACVDLYRDYIDLHWVCLPLSLRNAVSNFEPRWQCWQPGADWIREYPPYGINNDKAYPFFSPGMEFEEFMVEFGYWYSGPNKVKTGAFVGIRADESLNRFRTIASPKKTTLGGRRWTTRVSPDENYYNIYPIYDWATSDIWKYHQSFPELPSNKIYDLMHRAGVPLSQMRLCQPYGDDQRKGLWLFHILEPKTWPKIVRRVSGANSGSLYAEERGNITGVNKISKPSGHTWKSFSELLFASLPDKTKIHYGKKFSVFKKWWTKRGYPEGLPDETPIELENKALSPSYRRICKVLLRNDYWCKGLHFSQPKSEAYKAYLERRKQKESN